MIRLSDQEFHILCEFMRKRYGINLIKKRVLIEYRLMNVLAAYQVNSFSEYIHLIKQDTSGKMMEELINKITTNYTFFLREPAHFTYIMDSILPQANLHTPFHIWVAGCSSGQECYTLAMLLEDQRRNGKPLPHIRITASDISQKVLNQAKEACYPMEAMEKLPEHWQQQYCKISSDGRMFQLKEIIRKQVVFTYHNLMEPAPCNQYHLILCRNVLIYFDEVSRHKICQSFAKCLKKRGYLILGHAEMMPQNNPDFEYLKSSIYRLKEMRQNE